jgi:hypothetical protein
MPSECEMEQVFSLKVAVAIVNVVFFYDRFLAAVLRTSVSVSWAEALLPDEILSRVLWIVGNTLNSTLLEKVQY